MVGCDSLEVNDSEGILCLRGLPAGGAGIIKILGEILRINLAPGEQ